MAELISFALFERVKTHLLTQNERSMAPLEGHTKCAYRGSENRTCAIGCLITKQYYDPSIEGAGISYSGSVRPAVEASLGRTLNEFEVDMLAHFQHIHDVEPVEQWEKEIENLRLRRLDYFRYDHA